MKVKVIDISKREGITPQELEEIIEKTLKEINAKTALHMETLESYGWIIIIYE